MIKKLSILFILLLALSGCSSNTENVQESPTETESYDSADESFRENEYRVFAELLDDAMDNNNHKIESDANGINVYIWEPTLLMSTIYAADGEESMVSAWEDFKQAYIGMCNDTMEELVAHGVEDPNVSFHILSDEVGKGATMLDVENGIITYDVVETLKDVNNK